MLLLVDLSQIVPLFLRELALELLDDLLEGDFRLTSPLEILAEVSVAAHGEDVGQD